MSHEIIPEIPQPELERPYKIDFEIDWDNIYILRPLGNRRIRIKRLKSHPQEADQLTAGVIFNLKVTTSLIQQKNIENPQFKPQPIKYSDPEYIIQKFVQFSQYNSYILINQNKLIIKKADQNLAKFLFESVTPFELEIRPRVRLQT
jgi:hypothetical protein